jgi:hypothetical protein
VELETARNEVLRKIGRNMLLFQQVEHMLKFLIANGNISGSFSEVKANLKQQSETIHSQTMGQLVGQFLDGTYLENDESTEDQETLTEPYFNFSFSVESDKEYYESRKRDLASIVADRNELIHHLLPRFNPGEIESCLEIDKQLEQQREKLILEIDHLKSLIDSLQKGRKELAAFILSDEGKKQIDLQWLRQSRLVQLLSDAATQAARPDGWTLLNIAGQVIRDNEPEEIATMNQRYGYKTLKKFLLASELFEITEEPTDKGGIRVLYRLKNQ